MRILVVEDEPLIAMLLEEMLEESGYVVVGPASTLQEGLELAESAPLEGAILDVNINGDRSFPIADVLVSRSIPHFFATGYGSAESVVRRGAEIVRKPFREDVLAAALRRLVPPTSPARSLA